MDVVETKSEGLAREYKATAPASEIDAKLDAKIDAVRPTAQLKGFRKGKAPRSVLKQMFGKSMLGEVMQELVSETVSKHLEANEHRPVGEPQIRMVNEDFKPGDDLSIEFSYELLPTIPEVALSEIKLERLSVTVDQESVDKALQTLADNAKNYETKEGAAESGDQVVIDFVGKIDGEAFEGGSAEDFPLGLGSGQFIPGFEDQLIGVAAGEERDVSVTFPENYGAEALAGKEAVFSVTVKEVKAPQAAAIDDELAKKYGAESLDDLTQQVRERIADEYRGGARQLLKRKLLDHLADAVSFELPPSMLEGETKEIAHQLWHEENPDHHGHDHGEIEPTDEHRALAERRVKLGLLLAEIGRKNEIQVTEAEAANAIMAQARNYPGQEKAFFELAQQNERIRNQLTAPVFEDKVIDFIVELADVTEREVDIETLKAEMEKLGDQDEAAS